MVLWTAPIPPWSSPGVPPVSSPVRKDLPWQDQPHCSVGLLGPGTGSSLPVQVPFLILLTWALGVLNSWGICADFCYDLCVAAVRCEAVTWPEEGFVTCDHGPADLTYRSRCDFRCSEGYVLDGPSSIECTAQGQWSEPVPKCKGRIYCIGKYSFLVTGEHTEIRIPTGSWLQTKLCAVSCFQLWFALP